MSKRKIYHLETCNTCQRIIKEIEAEKNGFELQNVKENHISEAELDELYKHTNSYEALFNKRAMKYRPLKEVIKSEQDFKENILKEYTFLKRPIAVVDDELFLGNSKKTVEALKEKINEA